MATGAFFVFTIANAERDYLPIFALSIPKCSTWNTSTTTS